MALFGQKTAPLPVMGQLVAAFMGLDIVWAYPQGVGGLYDNSLLRRYTGFTLDGTRGDVFRFVEWGATIYGATLLWQGQKLRVGPADAHLLWMRATAAMPSCEGDEAQDIKRPTPSAYKFLGGERAP